MNFRCATEPISIHHTDFASFEELQHSGISHLFERKQFYFFGRIRSWIRKQLIKIQSTGSFWKHILSKVKKETRNLSFVHAKRAQHQ